MKPANDNNAPPRADTVIGKTLANRTVFEHHVTDGLQAMLRESRVSPAIRRAVAEFISPALAVLDRMEADIIDYARAPAVSAHTVELFDAVVARLEGFDADVQAAASRHADLRPMATAFNEFVSGVAKAWEPPMAKEIDEPDLDR